MVCPEWGMKAEGENQLIRDQLTASCHNLTCTLYTPQLQPPNPTLHPHLPQQYSRTEMRCQQGLESYQGNPGIV